MSSIQDEFDNDKFELPGINSRGYASYSLATSLIHSGRYNMRGLECYSYGFYTILLQDLVSHLAPAALVIPQFGVGALMIEADNGDLSDSDSIVTISQRNLSQLFPDFAVVLMRAVFVDGGQPVTASAIRNKFVSWRDIKIERLSISILAEAKRRPTRTALDRGDFAQSLKSRIDKAMNDLERQAYATFAAYPGTDRLILIAFAGEWFCWKLSSRKDTADNNIGETSVQAGTTCSVVQVIQPNVAPDDISDTPQSNRGRLPRAAKSNPIRPYRTSPSPEIPESSKIPYKPNPNRGRKRVQESLPPQKVSHIPRRALLKRYVPDDLTGLLPLQKLLTKENWQYLNEADGSFEAVQVLIGKEWSGYSLFGTRESKESWFLIRKALEDQVTWLNNFHNNMLPNDFELAQHEDLDPDEMNSAPNSDDEEIPTFFAP